MSNANDMAFPVNSTELTPNNTYQHGLTKREYIATHAMNGLMATIQPGDAKITHEKLAALVATVCVAFADALLAELAKAQS